MNISDIPSKFFVLMFLFFATSENAQQIKNIGNMNTPTYAPINGLRMYYEIHGDGSIPLVLIHGGGSTIETSFGNLLPLLSAKGKVIAVELQGHGRTNDRNGPESYVQDAEDVAALMEFLNIDKANFLGFSNGGTATLQIAIRHAELANKIIIISSNYKREGMVAGFFEGLQKATLADMPEPLKEGYLKVAPDKSHLHTMFEKDRDRMVAFKDINDDDIRSIHAPALIMVGDHDVVSPEHALKMSHLISNSRLVVLPGTHGSFIGEACTVEKGSKLPQMSADLIEEFLKK
jgi:pimeloyl-ACP methyl ester carboxylesterase